MATSIAIAAAFSLVLAYAVHCLTVYALRHGTLPDSRWRLVLRYGLGTGTIGLVLGVWCAVAGQLTAFLAWAAIAAAAGLGTIGGHGLDSTGEKDNKITFLTGQNDQLKRELDQLKRDRGEPGARTP